jgi:DNA-binding transcriptional LysR family regulator
MIDAAAVEHFPEHLRAFRRTNPDVVLRLIVSPSGELLEMLRRGELDVAVLVEPARADDDIDIDILLDEPIVVVAPEGQAIGEPASWGPWVLFPRGSHTRLLIESNLRALGATVEVVAESHQPEVLREMARLGVGWTALPQAQASSRGDQTAEVGPVLGTRRLVVARRRTRTAHPAAETFVETLRGDCNDGNR